MSWRDAAACRGMTALFFPERQNKADIAAAKAVCAGCPVKVECREYAICARERIGVWGGVQAQSLQNVRAARNRGRTRTCVTCGRGFAPTNGQQRACSRRCARRRQLERIKEWKRARRSLRMLDAGHGTFPRYQSGCRCPACRCASREYRRRCRASA